MNQLDREFIVTTVKASEKELRTFIVSFVTEQVSEEINALAFVTSKGFERVDKRIDDFQDNMNARLEGVNRRIDKIDVNMVKIEDFARLEKRVSKLEKATT